MQAFWHLVSQPFRGGGAMLRYMYIATPQRLLLFSCVKRFNAFGLCLSVAVRFSLLNTAGRIPFCSLLFQTQPFSGVPGGRVSDIQSGTPVQQMRSFRPEQKCGDAYIIHGRQYQVARSGLQTIAGGAYLLSLICKAGGGR